MDQAEFYLSVYQDYREHARHSESTRETANNFMLAISAAIIGIMTYDEKLCRSDIPLSISLIVLGILGFLSSVAYTARYQRNRIRASYIKKEFDKLYSSNNNKIESIQELKEKADTEYKEMRSNIFSINGLLKEKVSDNNLTNQKKEQKKTSLKEMIKDGGHHVVWFLFPSVLIIVGIILTILARGKC
ncbi:MAG: hypothetical protein QNJ42_19895 [Crocosphaera sp.]|nr:hypothetical protein [Crocosphaera sp.]